MEVMRKVSAEGIDVGVVSTEGLLEVLEGLVELFSTGCTSVYSAEKSSCI